MNQEPWCFTRAQRVMDLSSEVQKVRFFTYMYLKISINTVLIIVLPARYSHQGGEVCGTAIRILMALKYWCWIPTWVAMKRGGIPMIWSLCTLLCQRQWQQYISCFNNVIVKRHYFSFIEMLSWLHRQHICSMCRQIAPVASTLLWQNYSKCGYKLRFPILRNVMVL